MIYCFEGGYKEIKNYESQRECVDLRLLIIILTFWL